MAKPAQKTKASVLDKARSSDRDWLLAKELATAIGWRTHMLRDSSMS